jgi:hypothetical protein
MPNDIICDECYHSLLEGRSIVLKDGSTKIPSVKQTELGQRRKDKQKDNRYTNKWLTGIYTQTTETQESAEIDANGGTTDGDMAAMHALIQKIIRNAAC